MYKKLALSFLIFIITTIGFAQSQVRVVRADDATVKKLNELKVKNLPANPTNLDVARAIKPYVENLNAKLRNVESLTSEIRKGFDFRKERIDNMVKLVNELRSISDTKADVFKVMNIGMSFKRELIAVGIPEPVLDFTLVLMSNKLNDYLALAQPAQELLNMQGSLHFTKWRETGEKISLFMQLLSKIKVSK